MSLFKSRKFRVDILTIFITLFLISIIGVTYYFYTQSNAAVLRVANGLISRTIDNITQKLNQFLQPTPLFSIANMIMNDAKLDDADMKALAAYMHVVLQSYPQLMNAYIADTKGNLFIESRIADYQMGSKYIPFTENITLPQNARYVSTLLQPAHDHSHVRFIFKNALGIEIHQDQANPLDFDPRQRPWFINARDNHQQMWIGIYTFYKSPEHVITVAFPVYANGVFMGVAAADISSNAIRDAISSYALSTNGVVFIANDEGQIISDRKDLLGLPKHQNIATINTTQSPLIKTAYNKYRSTHQSHFTFDYDGITYISQFKTYTVSGKETWLIAAVVPIDVYVGGLRQVNRNVLTFALLVLILGLWFVIVSSSRISNPIIKLAAETKKMRRLHFTKSAPIHSHIYEVQVMESSVNAAKSALASFSKYVPKLLVEQLMRKGDIATLGGEIKNVTILFSDIQNFTHLSEKSDPNSLILCLSDYLNTMTDCIHANYGNIDKYIGDGIMAFWGAPNDDVDQIKHACRAVLLCRDKAKLYKNMRTRFGLHAGPAIVGNVGSKDRLNYTAIGDTVNLAARLEELNKQYGTEIIVSESVYQAVQNEFMFRYLDTVKVQGKDNPVKIYELLTTK